MMEALEGGMRADHEANPGGRGTLSRGSPRPSSRETAAPPGTPNESIGLPAVISGAFAGAALAAGYVGVVAGTAGWAHLGDQLLSDWWLVTPLLLGFAVQVALFVELRRRHRLARAATAAIGAGGGMSAAGMVACCAHHLTDLAPLVGAAGAASFLTAAQRPLMYLALAVNVVAVTVAVRRLRRTTVVVGEEPSCPV